MKKILTATVMLSVLNIFAGTLKFECSVNRENAIYKAGEKIIFTVKLTEDGKTAADKFIQYRLYHDDKEMKKDKVSAAGELKIETSSDKPGWIYIQVWAKDSKNKFIKQLVKDGGKTVDQARSIIGAMVEPEKLLPPMREPEDFDAFWDQVKKELAAVPMKVLEKVRIPEEKRVELYDVKISCAGEKPVSGYLCVPLNAKPKSCPAFVGFHGAGVRSSYKRVDMAARGVIALDINAHGIENGKPQSFYDDLKKNYYNTTLDKFRPTRYAHWNKHDRDKYYFKGMYMRLMRALEYVKSLPEWDGKHLIVSGGSQGGAQVLAACALDHDITFARAGVPAMCDHSGCLGDRRSGWPALYTRDVHRKDPAYAKCASYYDGAYFARRIRCPIWINTGFADNTCPPTSVFAAYNSIPAKTEKHMQTCPDGGHGTPHSEGMKAMNNYIDSILKKQAVKK